MQNLSRWLIPIFSGLALWFAGKPGPRQKWGFLLGGVTQGLWFIASIFPWCPWLFCATVVYTIGWGRGILNYWFPHTIEYEKNLIARDIDGNLFPDYKKGKNAEYDL